jgi:hypothetical protein
MPFTFYENAPEGGAFGVPVFAYGYAWHSKDFVFNKK